MNENLDASGSNLSNAEKEIESTLRPGRFDHFTGQPGVVNNLKIFVEVAI